MWMSKKTMLRYMIKEQSLYTQALEKFNTDHASDMSRILERMGEIEDKLEAVTLEQSKLVDLCMSIADGAVAELEIQQMVRDDNLEILEAVKLLLKRMEQAEDTLNGYKDTILAGIVKEGKCQRDNAAVLKSDTDETLNRIQEREYLFAEHSRIMNQSLQALAKHTLLIDEEIRLLIAKLLLNAVEV